LAEGSRGSAGLTWRRLGSKLVVLELTTAVILLAGAGLLAKSLYRLLHVETGLRPDHLATLIVTLPDSYETGAQVAALERRLIARIENLPGVQSAGLSTSLPLSGWGMDANIIVPGRPSNGGHNVIAERDVSSEYLQALGAKLVRGRYFSAQEDDPQRPSLAVVNQAFVAQYYPGQDPMGKQFTYETTHQAVRIIGIVDDVKEGQLDSTNRAAIYVPFTQGWFRSFGIVVRTSEAGQSLLSSISGAIHQVDRGIATDRVMTMSAVLDNSQAAYVHRSSAWMVGGFAALALLLSVVGLYGVVAYSVGQRTREVGIRMALGAGRGLVYRLILKEAGGLTLTGIAIGLAGSIAAAALMRNLLFGVETWDVPTLGAVAVTLGAAALLASYLPARRAASVNPVEALRNE
jgi:predicted permease